MKKRKIPYNLIIFDIVLIVAASAVTTAALLLSKHSILIVRCRCSPIRFCRFSTYIRI